MSRPRFDGVDDGRRGRGFVWLVGAGPGDPELLTLRAARVLAAADVVFHDGLVSPEVLALAPRAQRFSVAKRAASRAGVMGRSAEGIAQESIHRLLVRAARRGKRVVRLKGGDPFVFGRGGEEALALAEAGIPFAVVPGVSSALAAPALAGIPVTHRGTASAFVVVSGHTPSAYRPVVDSLAPGSATLVVLMGVDGRGELAAALLARGWSPATPAALLLAASTPATHEWTGTLDELASAAPPDELCDAPGTIVVGEVVALAARLRGSAPLPRVLPAAVAFPAARARRGHEPSPPASHDGAFRSVVTPFRQRSPR